MSFEGTYQLMPAYINGKVAYQKGQSGPILAYNEADQIFEIKDNGVVRAWGLNYDGVCPQGADDSWHIEPRDPYTGFTMISEYEPAPTPAPSGRCQFSNDFVRHCAANGGWYTTLFNLSAEECLRMCSDVYDECVVAHHHPSFQIWPDGTATNCWLWSEAATPCAWGGAETITGHPGATMIRCNDGMFRNNIIKGLKRMIYTVFKYIFSTYLYIIIYFCSFFAGMLKFGI
mgnify:CR=1 FL=1